MKKVISILAISLVVVFSGVSQNKDLKGPRYKNAKPSEKYKGQTSILIKQNPTQFSGPEFKNFKSKNYEKEIKDFRNIQLPPSDLIVSSENKLYSQKVEKETIIYRRVRTKDMKGINSKGLKGPAYKNRKPGK